MARRVAPQPGGSRADYQARQSYALARRASREKPEWLARKLREARALPLWGVLPVRITSTYCHALRTRNDVKRDVPSNCPPARYKNAIQTAGYLWIEPALLGRGAHRHRTRVTDCPATGLLPPRRRAVRRCPIMAGKSQCHPPTGFTEWAGVVRRRDPASARIVDYAEDCLQRFAVEGLQISSCFTASARMVCRHRLIKPCTCDQQCCCPWRSSPVA